MTPDYDFEVGDLVTVPDEDEPVTVLEIDRHQILIDNGWDSRWVRAHGVAKATGGAS